MIMFSEIFGIFMQLFSCCNMLYQLPNGRCIELSAEQYLHLTDYEWNALLKDMEASQWGEEVNDPFAISVLHYGFAGKKKVEDEEDDDYYINEHEPDLIDISDVDKLSDSDFIDIDNIEI